MRWGAYRKAKSPVMVTVLLVVVAVTITVAVAYWMSGISGQYTKFEKIELSYASCKAATSFWDSSPYPCWNITLYFKNTGTIDSSIISCLVNNKPIDEYGYETQVFTEDNIRAYDSSFTQINFAEILSFEPVKYVVKPGDSDQLVVTIRKLPASATDYSFSSGTALALELRTNTGKIYMKMITLT